MVGWRAPDSVAYVDERYTWRVPLASALTNGLALGFGKCSGLVVIAMAEEDMPLRASTVLLAAGLNICLMMMLAPAVDLLANRCSSRVVASAGALLNIVALLLAAFHLSAASFLPLVGLLLSCGFSLCFAPPLLIYGLCFRRYRTLAAGVAFSGESLGCALLPFLVTALVDRYTVRGAMLVLAAVFAHILIPAVALPTVVQDRESGEELLRQRQPCRGRRESEPPINRRCPQPLQHPVPTSKSAILVYAASIMLTNFAYFNQITGYPLLSSERGVSRSELRWFIAAQGLVEFLCRLLFGFLCDRLSGSAKLAIVLGTEVVFAGAAFLVSSFPGNLSVLAAYVALVGLCGGSLGSLWTVVVVHLVGTANSARGLALYLMAVSAFAFVCLAAMGYVQTAIGSYEWVVRIGGVSALGAAMLQAVGVLPVLRRVERSERARRGADCGGEEEGVRMVETEQ